MSFINLPVFAFGSLLIAAPIALHLMMRQKPRRAAFPALQFVRKKQIVNQQRMKLRHLALLALRCAVILGIAAALARPIVASAAAGGWWLSGLVAALALGTGVLAAIRFMQGRGTIRSAGLAWGLAAVAALLTCVVAGLVWRLINQPTAAMPIGDVEEPLAAVMVFDTSPRMGLVQENESRLDVARKAGLKLLRKLPTDSEVAIVTTQKTGDAFSIDRAAAGGQITKLETAYVVDPLPETIERAIDLLGSSEKERREVYVFTDLTSVSWPDAVSSDDETENQPLHPIANRMSNEDSRPAVYVIDIGSETPGNVALGELRLSREHLAPKSSLDLQVELNSVGLAESRQVQLFIEKQDASLPVIVDGEPKLPEAVLRSQRQVTLEPGQSQWIDFAIRGLEVGTHHGEVRILGEDGLAVDDVRHFAVYVREATRVLAVSGEGAQPRFIINALSPLRLRETDSASFVCQTVSPQQFAKVDLDPFAAVLLLDPPNLDPVAWRSLTDYVSQGGGLVTFLGRNADASFGVKDGMSVLPATPSRVWRVPESDLTIALRKNSHPILRVLQPMASSIPWRDFPIAKHWTVEPHEAGHVVLRYANGKPALLERRVGEGRSLMFTTPVSDPLNVKGRAAWNRGTDSWPYLVLVNEFVKYAASGAELPLNYIAGQTATLTQFSDDPDRIQMFHPMGNWQEVVARRRNYDVPFTEMPGAYRFKSPPNPNSPERRRTRGFAVNLPSAATRLDRIAGEDLDSIFGPSNYQLVRDETNLERELGAARKGYEFYPWMMVMVVSVLALEHLLSNRFYGSGAQADNAHVRRATARRAAAELKAKSGSGAGPTSGMATPSEPLAAGGERT